MGNVGEMETEGRYYSSYLFWVRLSSDYDLWVTGNVSEFYVNKIEIILCFWIWIWFYNLTVFMQLPNHVSVEILMFSAWMFPLQLLPVVNFL